MSAARRFDLLNLVVATLALCLSGINIVADNLNKRSEYWRNITRSFAAGIELGRAQLAAETIQAGIRKLGVSVATTPDNRQDIYRNSLAWSYSRASKMAVVSYFDRLGVKLDPDKYNWQDVTQVSEIAHSTYSLLNTSFGTLAGAALEAGVEVGYLELASWTDLVPPGGVKGLPSKLRTINVLAEKLDLSKFPETLELTELKYTLVGFAGSVRRAAGEE